MTVLSEIGVEVIINDCYCSRNKVPRNKVIKSHALFVTNTLSYKLLKIML